MDRFKRILFALADIDNDPRTKDPRAVRGLAKLATPNGSGTTRVATAPISAFA